MTTISVQDIQRDPTAFLRLLEAGESLIVTRGERQVAEVRPLNDIVSAMRPYGLGAGQFVTPSNFDEPLPLEILNDFYGT